ncbi:hypothetical protein L873DRAFT_1785789 [Choiromyces venosus 120613-1]|uniref:Uncharacterized protein n=1 Tax=Choiromyces venosus 120613-1 TaxID=1336337 RepID=A0A3N4K7A3_9PEZI|nr:hypothetical protein L873DRAFT_1785789 [Choiromyces venosus 120613-1]
MRQKAFTRPAPIKTNISPKIETTVVTATATTATVKKPLPVHPSLAPLSPRTELELRRSCSRLLSSASTTSASSPKRNGKSSYVPSNAAQSFTQTTNTKFETSSGSNTDISPGSPPLKDLVHVNTIAKPPTPPSSNGTVAPYNFSKTALARKMSLGDVRKTRTPSPAASTTPNPSRAKSHAPLRIPVRTPEPPIESINPEEIGQAKLFESSAVQMPVGLKRKPSLIRVTPRPKTSSGAESRTHEWVKQELERRRNEGGKEKEKLVLFPRPNTSHSMKTDSLRKELAERPLPPLPQIPTRSKTMENAIGPLRSLRRQLSVFFGRRKDRHAQGSPVPSRVVS